MHLVFNKSSKGYVYVYLMESTRDPKTGKITKRLVKNYGRRDILEKDNPGLLEELKERYKPRAQRAYESQRAAICTQEHVDELVSADTVVDMQLDSFNYGWLVLKRLWTSELNLDKPFNYLSNTKYEYTKNKQGQNNGAFSLNTIGSMLVLIKALGGASILSSYQSRSNYLGMPKENLSLSEIYRVLSMFANSKDYIVSALRRTLDKKLGGDNYSMVFYDITNSYVDCLVTDTKPIDEMPKYQGKLISMKNEALKDHELGFDGVNDEAVVDSKSCSRDFLEQRLKQKISSSRHTDASKASRENEPHKSVVLVINKYGIPVDYAVFHGSMSEDNSMEQVIKGFQDKYQIKEAIVVADQDLDLAKKLRMIEDSGMGYIVAKNISQLDKDVLKDITDQSGYISLPTSDNTERSYKIIANLKKNDAQSSVHSTLLVTFDENRKRRDEAIIDGYMGILNDKVQTNTKDRASNSSGSLFSDVTNSSDDLKVLDERALRMKHQLSGYTAYIFKTPDSPKSSECYDSKEDVACVYEKLIAIERNLKFMKSKFDLRSKHLRKDEHISANELFNFLALVILCYLERRLHEQGHMLSIDQIITVLNKMNVVKISSRKVYEFDEPIYGVQRTFNGSEGEYLYVNLGTEEHSVIPLSHAHYYILKCLGLKALPARVSKTSLCGCLRTKFRAPSEGSINL